MREWAVVRGLFIVSALLGLAGPAGAQAGVEAVDALLREGGNVLLIRHAATVSGVGDPPGFRVDDCSTQRNLSDRGRADAQRLGERLQASGGGVWACSQQCLVSMPRYGAARLRIRATALAAARFVLCRSG